MRLKSYRLLLVLIALHAITAATVCPQISNGRNTLSSEGKVSSNTDIDSEIQHLTEEQAERKRDAEFWDRWNIRATFLAGLAATLLVITAVGVSRSNRRLAKASDDLADLKESAVNFQLTEAKRRQANAEEKSALAQLALQQYIDRIAKHQRPRLIGGEAARELVQELKQRPKGKATIAYKSQDAESRGFALQIQELLSESGWDVPEPTPIPNDFGAPGSGTGMTIEYGVGTDQGSDSASSLLVSALSLANGKTPVSETYPNLAVNTFNIIVGQKP